MRRLDATPPSPRPPGALVAWYAFSTGAIALTPWLGPLLTDAGWSESQASALLLVLPIGRLVGGPLWSWVADRAGAEGVLRGTTVVAAACALGMLAPVGPLPLVWLLLAFTVVRAPTFSIADATTLRLVGRNYGKVRAVGSAAFLVTVGLCGVLRDGWAPAPLALSAALLIGTAAVTWALPPLDPPAAPPGLQALLRLLRHPVLLPLSVVGVLHGAALSAYDNLFALHVESLGLPATVTGAGLVVGVGVEVLVLGAGARLLGALGPNRLMLLALIATVPRYLVTAASTSAVALVAVQGLHGLQFGAFWLAGATLYAENAPAALRNSTQALLPATSFGAGPLLGLGAATFVLRAWDTSTLYLVMAAVGALAVAVWLRFAPEPRP